jgi:Aspartyl protease
VQPASEFEATARASADDFVTLTRDRWERFHAPVRINGQGPFGLVVNTGANVSAITQRVAQSLGCTLDGPSSMLVHGVADSVPVQSIRVNAVSVGKTVMSVSSLPVIADPLGCADGFLALLGFVNEQVLIDFQRNKLGLLRAAQASASATGVVTLPLDLSHRQLPVVKTRVHRVAVNTVIDTGSPSTCGNAALYDLLKTIGRSFHRSAASRSHSLDTRIAVPRFELGSLRIIGARITFDHTQLFGHINLLAEPAMVLGMDVLRQFGGLQIDYRKPTVQFLPRNHAS